MSIYRVIILLVIISFLFNSCRLISKLPTDEAEIAVLCKSKKITRIHEIQGVGHRSPLENSTIQCVTGIVTAVSGTGFYLQDLIEDGDDRSSEAIFVAHSSGSMVKKGDRVLVYQAMVKEHKPTLGQSNSLSITQLVNPKFEVLSSGHPLPKAVILGKGGRVIPNLIIENDLQGYVGRDNALFDPEEDGMDFFESLEGMLVEVHNAVAVTSTNRYNELTVVADEGVDAGLFADTGVLVIRENDYNPERILLDDTFIQIPKIYVGAKFTEPIRGVISYDFGNYRLLPTEKLVYEKVKIDQAKAEPPGGKPLSIATYNVENLAANEESARFEALAEHVVDSLLSPDILVLQEVLDDDGATDSKTVSAQLTIEKIIKAIMLNGGPEYHAISIDPERNSDGGISGGNGRIVILYRPDTGLKFNGLGEAGARTETELIVEDGRVALSHNPGRIWPNNSCFRNSRKALIAQFEYKGENLFVIGVHFSSKGEDGPLYGEIQPPPLPSESRRIAQAKAVNAFVKQILETDASANVVVLGDINDFYWTETVHSLMGEELKNTTLSLPERNRYSYIYQGNGQMMDQIFLSASLHQKMLSLQVIHLNTAEIEIEAFSDHDPVIVYLGLE